MTGRVVHLDDVRLDDRHEWRLDLEHERSLSALGAYLAAFEAENGIITDEAISSARRATRARAINVRKRIPAPSAGKGSRADRKAR